MISKIEKSPLKNKRYRVYLTNNKHYDFGLPTGYTFIDGASDDTKFNYKKRHIANKIEKNLINNLIPSPSLFSYYILWGKYRDINKNIEYLNNLLKKS